MLLSPPMYICGLYVSKKLKKSKLNPTANGINPNTDTSTQREFDTEKKRQQNLSEVRDGVNNGNGSDNGSGSGTGTGTSSLTLKQQQK